MKKITIHGETAYFLSILILSLAVAMITAADFGVSMIVAPAYILSLRFPFLTFGQAEYIVQGVLFFILCVVIKKIKPIFFCSFITGIIYGAILDMWRMVIPQFNPEVTVPGSMQLPIRITYFIVGMLMTSFSIALVFRTYIYTQVYDFFVKMVSAHFSLNRVKFKTCFDLCFLAVSCALTFILFRRLNGVGIATLIMALCNGFIIGLFGKLLDKYFDFKPAFLKLSKHFDIS